MQTNPSFGTFVFEARPSLQAIRAETLVDGLPRASRCDGVPSSRAILFWQRRQIWPMMLVKYLYVSDRNCNFGMVKPIRFGWASVPSELNMCSFRFWKRQLLENSLWKIWARSRLEFLELNFGFCFVFFVFEIYSCFFPFRFFWGTKPTLFDHFVLFFRKPTTLLGRFF